MPGFNPVQEPAAGFSYLDGLNFAVRHAPHVRQNPFLLLMCSIVVDIIGFSSYFLPFVGELGDVAWAPLQALFLQYMYGGVLIAAVGFLEEIGPGTDILPTATIAWGIAFLPMFSQLRRTLRFREQHIRND